MARQSYDWTRLHDLKRRLEYAERRNISWRELSERMELPDATLKKIAYGRTKSPTADTVTVIVDFFQRALEEAGALEEGEKIDLSYFQTFPKGGRRNKNWANSVLEIAQSSL